MKFYRYECGSHEGYTLFDGNYVVFNLNLRLDEYNLHKETPKGYWIGYGESREGSLTGYSKWVSKTARKRYAYPTKEEALNYFIKRKESHALHLDTKLQVAKSCVQEAKKELEKFKINLIKEK